LFLLYFENKFFWAQKLWGALPPESVATGLVCGIKVERPKLAALTCRGEGRPELAFFGGAGGRRVEPQAAIPRVRIHDLKVGRAFNVDDQSVVVVVVQSTDGKCFESRRCCDNSARYSEA